MTMGILIENKDPKEILNEISEGKYKQEIISQKTDVSSDKKKNLLEFFESLKTQQTAVKKAEEAEKAAAEEKKTEAATDKTPAKATATTKTPAKAATKAPAKKK